MKVLVESQYFPSVAYFSLISHAQEVWIEAQEKFEKQSYRNRCEILGANGVHRLSIPVRFANSGLPIQSMQIDHDQKWINNHWRAIQSAYGKAPFFDYYSEYIHEVLYQPFESLFELNQGIMTLCLKVLGIQVKINFTEKYDLTISEDIFDGRSVIHPKKDINQLTWFRPKTYYQVFGKDFVPNLSILDLLFCMGPDSLVVLKESSVFLKNK